MSQFFTSGGHSIGVLASASVLPMNIQDWLPLGWTGWISLQAKGLSRVFSNTTIQKRQFFGTQPSFLVRLSHPYMTTGKIIALTLRTSVGKVMSLLLNTLFRSVIAFKQVSFNFVAAVNTIHNDFGTEEYKTGHYFHCFPIYLPWSDGTRCIILVFWMLSFYSAFSLSSFTFKRLFSSSSFSAFRVVSSVYPRLLIFLLAFLISAYESSSRAFGNMYPAYKLNKQGDNIQPWCTPFPILNQSIVLCLVLTVA